MKDLNQIIKGLSQSGLLSGLAGGLAGGALGGALTSKKGRKVGKSVLKVGALAAVGGVAWKAYQAYSQRNTAAQSPAPAGADTRIDPAFDTTRAAIPHERFVAAAADDPGNTSQMLLLRAMISAAYADGHIDAAEKERIFEQVEQMNLSTADKAALFDELRHPLSLHALVKLVPNAETGIEVYAAATMAIDQTQPASAGYLNQLAANLRLPDELVRSIHQEVETADSAA
ncbi:tellurite resistance TerB family protein [Exilibacterium tricleocarpae]|uniref:Tellurite resistance TerB family protein n=1 Tax=Exilibacterium tricleocarpae TaxID=2591008 RepID=A0A545ST38_9GAMM|nr:tellurite resistance TerB family protein [Exilibacterium tricleocarpae]TQV68132.1 tellurite resistance TerB family protein [Exilibacterium tricleocarpae]